MRLELDGAALLLDMAPVFALAAAYSLPANDSDMTPVKWATNRARMGAGSCQSSRVSERRSRFLMGVSRAWIRVRVMLLGEAASLELASDSPLAGLRPWLQEIQRVRCSV